MLSVELHCPLWKGEEQAKAIDWIDKRGRLTLSAPTFRAHSTDSVNRRFCLNTSNNMSDIFASFHSLIGKADLGIEKINQIVPC